jgi:RNA polymerase sigma-54 factor
MKQSLNLRQSQKLAMTPHLQQAIKMLQMSANELSEELQHAYEINPLLELREDGDQEPGSVGIEEDLNYTSGDSTDETSPASDIDVLEFNHIPDPDQAIWDDPQNYAPIDQRRPTTAASVGSDESGSQFVIPEEPSTLRESLGSQAIFLFADEDERRIAHHIIQNINEAGYIDVPLSEIQQTLAERSPVEMYQIEQVLGVIQKLEPVGVGARSPRECLLLQLQVLEDSIPGYHIATEIVDRHLPLLANKEFSKLRKLLGISENELGVAASLIQQLNPHPGYSVGGTIVDYIVPDILVQKKGNHWYANINNNALPKIAINQDYQKLINQNADTKFESLKEQLQQARWLINNLEKRHKTIHSVAREIVERQQEFFHYGADKMQPLTLNDIAEPLGIHESTVSRATTGKYLSAPIGNFELKYFFSSQVDTVTGGTTSSIAIQSEIKRIIRGEIASKPISDEKICLLLADKGYKVARRTVAKYREQMNIPSSSRRKTL